MKKKVLLTCLLLLATGVAVAYAMGLSVSVSGCENSGDGTFGCVAQVSGGSGSYNYWWMYDGPGNLYQTNSSYVTITDCIDGTGTLELQAFDRETGQTGMASAYSFQCDCSPENDSACSIDIFTKPGCKPGTVCIG